jgi:hypothetical protein
MRNVQFAFPQVRAYFQHRRETTPATLGDELHRGVRAASITLSCQGEGARTWQQPAGGLAASCGFC